MERGRYALVPGRLSERLQNFADVETVSSACSAADASPRDVAREQTPALCELLADCAVTFLLAGTFQLF
jgi:hypothetical protein